jgi:hypothetical protein
MEVELKERRWEEIEMGELGLLSPDYDIEVDGDTQTVRILRKVSL